MVIDATARFSCAHEFVGLPLGGRPEHFRCHKCDYRKAIEVVLPGRRGVAAFPGERPVAPGASNPHHPHRHLAPRRASLRRR